MAQIGTVRVTVDIRKGEGLLACLDTLKLCEALAVLTKGIFPEETALLLENAKDLEETIKKELEATS